MSQKETQPTETATDESNHSYRGDQPDEEQAINQDESSDTEASQTVDEAAAQLNPDAQIEMLKSFADENYQKYLRVQADFDNFRKRSRLEREDFAKYASSKVIEQLLPVLDNFDRALSASKDNKDFDAFAKGVDMIYRQLDQAMEQEGLKPLEPVGQPFNPEYHQAIMQVETDEFEEGIVVEVLQKGYMLKDKILRTAMVKVSK